MRIVSLGKVFQLSLLAFALFLPGCVQLGGPGQTVNTPGDSVVAAPLKYNSFVMGGVKVPVPVPAGYVEAPSALRQAVAASFVPQQNVFAVYVPAGDKTPARGSGAKLLQNRKYYVVSARPEFMRETLDLDFFSAMLRDFKRVNGQFGPERLGQFKMLTEHYYAHDDKYEHSLGEYDSRANSLSLVRILRQAGSANAGAVSAYSTAELEQAASDANLALQSWDKSYFAGAYHQVSIQNIVRVNKRSLNIYFFAPLAEEADLYAALRENQEFMNSFTQGNRPDF